MVEKNVVMEVIAVRITKVTHAIGALFEMKVILFVLPSHKSTQ